MPQVTQQPGETRKDYLLRVAMIYIANYHGDEEIFFDGMIQNGMDLAGDIETELEKK